MLTERQKETLDFITSFFDRESKSPTAKEIAEGIGITSRGTVHRYLTALQESGYIKLIKNRHRNICMTGRNVEHDDYPIGLPLHGCIAAGQPIEAISNNETIQLSELFLGPDRYALKVKGDSMIDEGIFDGDIVVCQYQAVARNGQIVVALIDHQEATLKRLQNNNDGTVTLLPANSNCEPMTFSVNRITIQGIYIGLLRCHI